MSEFRYQVKKCSPTIALFFVLIAMFGLIYSPYLSAGETLFKECTDCGRWNYNSVESCVRCGETGKFEDIWLPEDLELKKYHDSRGIKRKKGKGCTSEYQYEDQKKIYDKFIAPINRILIKILNCRDYHKQMNNNLNSPHYFENIDAAFDDLLRSREKLVIFLGLEEYCHSHRYNDILYRD